MLHEFITLYRDTIIERTKARVAARPWPTVSREELEHGVPQFLSQLVEILQTDAEPDQASIAASAITSMAKRHGAELLAHGYSVSQVVHDYGDICQAVTALALEHGAPITVSEFHSLNLYLDIAIAGAVTEHARISAQTPSPEELARVGHSAHEMRDALNSAVLAFHALRRGTVPINGSTGAILGRSLISLGAMIDRNVTEIRLSVARAELLDVPLIPFLDEIGATCVLHSEFRQISFAIEAADRTMCVRADRQLLTSAVMNLLLNAFKFTPAGGHIVLRASSREQRAVIEVEDQCGGIPASQGDLFRAFADRRGTDRSGLGLGLSIARSAVQENGGEISVRNIPGKGCVFTIEMPLVPYCSPDKLASAASE